MYEELHPSDQELVMAADGELPGRRAASVSRHLASCGSCRARLRDIDRTTAGLVQLHHREFGSGLPPAAGPRALLRARLASLGNESQTAFTPRLLGLRGLVHSYRFAYAALLGATAVLLVIRFGLTGADAAAVPKPRLTPGATIPVTRQQVCDSGSLTQGPLVSASLQQQVFQAYGITNPRPGAYEIDYLITPDLGGAANLDNLWPQPYNNTVWNARVKDQLEERLHAMVCSGEIDLPRAQRDLATDWVAAYKKYFHTDRPQSGPSKTGNQARLRPAGTLASGRIGGADAPPARTESPPPVLAC